MSNIAVDEIWVAAFFCMNIQVCFLHLCVRKEDAVLKGTYTPQKIQKAQLQNHSDAGQA